MKYQNFQIFIFTFLSSNLLFAQKEANIWYFDKNLGLDFNYESPVRLYDSKMFTYNNSCSMADSNGKLLFYSNGDTIWNKNHKIMYMENLFGREKSFPNCINTIAIKKPLSNRYYYIFASDDCREKIFPSYFYYLLIDMEGNSGSGKVVKKGHLLSNSMIDLASVEHANRTDYWIAVQSKSLDTLFMFLLTKNGISLKKVNYLTRSDSLRHYGGFKFSPNGKYIAMSYQNDSNFKNYTYLYDFDNTTGTISNERKINEGGWNLEFSPNSKYIYIGNWGYNNKYLYQCKINKITSDFTADTSNSYLIKYSHLYRMQLAPNGKIYYTKSDSTLGVIHYPNEYGANCKFDSIGQKLIEDNSSNYFIVSAFQLPNFVSSYFKSDDFSISSRCINEPTRFLLIDSLDNDSVKWDFGDTTSGKNNFSNQLKGISHIYKMYGDYQVSLVTFYDGRSDTAIDFVSFKNPKPDFFAKNICENDSAKFINKSSESIGQLSYKWKFGNGQTSILTSPCHFFSIGGITKTYNVTLTVITVNGCKDSITKAVTVNANPRSDFSFSINKNTVDFKATQFGNTSYKWYFGNGDSSSSKDINYTYPKIGKYTACLKVINAADCFSKTCKEVLLTLGVSNISKSSGFKIYPNPNTGNFTLEIDSPAKDISVEVYDLLGKRVKKVERVEKVNIINLEVDAGIYLVKVNSSGGVWFQKVVVSQAENLD